MAFELKSVVPWGRNLDEYRRMFNLSEDDLSRNIISFGDGPASFNAEMHQAGKWVISVDPVYAFSKEALAQRIGEVKEEVMPQIRNNRENFVWDVIKDADHLEQIRMEAMQIFLADYQLGKEQGRYICHSLPDRTPFQEGQFELGLSSHFLILYDKLGLDFHLRSIEEMLRICKEIRIFPLVNLDAKESSVLEGVRSHFREQYSLTIETVDYEFQRNGNRMLRIRK